MEAQPKLINFPQIVRRSWLLVFLGLIIALLSVLFLSRDLPSLEQLENFDPDLVTRIYSADGKLSWEGEFNNNKRVGLWRFYSKDSIYEINY